MVIGTFNDDSNWGDIEVATVAIENDEKVIDIEQDGEIITISKDKISEFITFLTNLRYEWDSKD